MDNLNLDSDEAVIYTTQKLIISGVGHEAVLTGRRLIIIESETGHTRDAIPFENIERAVAGTNALREPVITFTIRLPEGKTRETELIFIHRAGGLDVQDRDKCIDALRDLKVPVQVSSYRPTPRLVRGRDNAETLTRDGEEPAARPAVPEWTVFGQARSARQPPSKESPQRSPLVIIIAAFLVTGVVLAGMFLLMGLGTGPHPVPDQKTVTGPDNITPQETGPAQAPPAPELTAAPVPETYPLPVAVPPDGIWVRVTYPGNFTGSLQAQGWNYVVNSSGTYLYQLPVHDTLIQGSIEKMDGSAQTMDVEIYNGGALVSKMITTKPFGTVDIHVAVGPAVINKPSETPAAAVVAAVPTPDASLALKAVPATGVWVRVAYPGNFTGTITANGRGQNVDSSGDQFFQLTMASGIIGGSVEKGDGSEKNMIVQVYKDGTLVTYGNTTLPLGIVEIHTTV